MRIEKYYGETVEINGKWFKVGTTLKIDKDFPTKELNDVNDKLFSLTKACVKKDIKKLREVNDE